MGLFNFRRKPIDPDNLPRTLNATQAITLVADGAALIDCREKSEWNSGHATEATHIPLATIQGSTARVPKNRPVLVVCASGMRSQQAANTLRAAGFNASSISGGMRAWQNAGGSVR